MNKSYSLWQHWRKTNTQGVHEKSFESCDTLALLHLETFKKHSKFTLHIQHNGTYTCVVRRYFYIIE